MVTLLIAVPFASSQDHDTETGSFVFNGNRYFLAPVLMEEEPGLESPMILADGTEIITARCEDGRYLIFPVTVSNELRKTSRAITGAMLYQLEVDTFDFPYLAEFGIHSELELHMTKSITGVSVGEITYLGRPDRSSGAGFMADDEDILSVISGDNQLVRKMNLTHPELATTLFHLWNVIQLLEYYSVHDTKTCDGLDFLLYNGRKIRLSSSSGHGWQSSIFSDSIRGMYQINISWQLSQSERDYLETHYGHLDESSYTSLESALSGLHTGEMVAYYIMRYGFYEGHTSYRADPVIMALAFNLVSLDQLDLIFDGQLYQVLNTHFKRKR